MNKKKISITVDKSIKKIIDREAEEKNISVSHAVERLIAYHNPEECVLKEDLVPILQNILSVLDGDERGLNAGKKKSVSKLLRKIWELL